ncbi:hypothetical protein GCM10025734_68510 [Kitasatospora paranensis]
MGRPGLDGDHPPGAGRRGGGRRRRADRDRGPGTGERPQRPVPGLPAARLRHPAEGRTQARPPGGGGRGRRRPRRCRGRLRRHVPGDGRPHGHGLGPAGGRPGRLRLPGGNGIPGFPGGDGGNGGDAFGGQGNGNGGSGQGNGGGLGGGLGNGQGNGKGNGKGSGSSATTAVDAVNGISLPIPSGWKGGTGTDGHASLIIGTYTCPDGSANCSLGGVVTGSLQGSDAKQAALADIAAAAKDSYGAIKGHQELKSEAVTVVGRSGYLVRWKVDAPQGNNGYVETVVFPGAKSGSLVSVRFGFDIAAKAPDVAVMDTIVQGIGTAAAGAQDGTNT